MRSLLRSHARSRSDVSRFADVCTPAHALRVLAPRRDEHDPGARGAGASARAGGARGHGSRGAVRGAEVLRGGARQRAEPDHRARGVRGAEEPARAQSGGADAVPPDAAGAERDRVPQPAAAFVGVAPRGVLLPAAGRSRAAGGTRRGTDRALGMPVGRGADGAAGVARRRRARGARVVPRRVPGALLRGAAGPRAGAVHEVQPPAGGAGAGARAAAGADQRLALHRARAGAPARRAAVHRHERDGARDGPVEARGRLVLRQVRGGDAGAAAGAAGGERQHRADRGAGRHSARLRADAAAGPGHPRGADGGRAPARRCASGGWPSAIPMPARSSASGCATSWR